MLVVNRFEVTDGAEAQFDEDARQALTALSRCRGFLRGRCGASVDEPEQRVLVTEWETVGAYRRALSAFDVKMYATPLLARAIPETSAFEVTLSAEGEDIAEYSRDRADGHGLRERESAVNDPERS